MAYLHDICVEEIALEGLEGITPACLWCRLQQRIPKFSLALDPKSKQFLWSGIFPNSDVEFFRLPEPRELPTFHHQYVNVDEGSGIVMINQEIIRKDYTVCIVNSAENDGVQGSCPTFKERVNVSQEVRGHDGSKVMTLEEIQEKWGDSLVIVASPELRHSTLMGSTGDPSVELPDLNYCLLEFIGRQRHHGISQVELGKAFNISAVTIFHYGKDLKYNNFIDKQSCWCETSKRTLNFTMLMLHRFSSLAKYITKGRYPMLASHITDFLETRPKKTAKVQVIKDLVKKKFSSWASKKDISPTFKKVYLMLQKMKVIQIVYAQGKCDLFNKVDSLKLLKKIPFEKEEPVEDELNDTYDPGVTSVRVAELPMQFQVYNLIDNLQHRPQGIHTQDIKRMLNLDKTSLRTLTDKALRGNNLITSFLTDEGRQRVNKFQTTEIDEKVSESKVLDTTPSSSKQNPTDPTPTKTLQTERYTMRREKILDMIKKQKVQEGPFAMLRTIRLDEADEGRTEKCDRKSVLRIIDRLVKEGLCKSFSTVVMSDDGKNSRTVSFITDTDVKQDDPRVLHIVQQVKFRIINYVNHFPVTNHIGSKQVKLQAKLPAVRKKCKKKTKPWKRISQFETLTQPSDDETEPSSHNALLEGEEKEDLEGMDKERRLVLKKSFYGHLQKMEKLKVFHTFMWYIVYGMANQEPAVETPQPETPFKQSEVMTIKQEFDEDQLTPVKTELDEVYLESSSRQGTDNLTGQPTNQPVEPVQITNQSERGSDGVVDGMITKTVKLEDRGSGSPASQSQGCPEDGSTPRDKHQGKITSSSQRESQTALSLFELIQQGNVPTETESDQSTSTDAPLNTTHKHHLISVELSDRIETANVDATTNPKPSHVPSVTPVPSLDHSARTEKHHVFLDVMDWRRFVKPLPRYQDIKYGWCILGDVVLSMPVGIFCKCVPLRYMIDKLSDYLNDPVKSLWLVKDLPLKIRSRLLEGRRYLAFLAREVDRLASMGLAIYTPHPNEGKEMLFSYICRNATIVDTSSSEPGGNAVSDKPYPVHKHHFRTLHDVEKFWFELKVICSDTPLGTARLNLPLSELSLKVRLLALPRKLDSHKDKVIDDGRIPGDGRGAAGLDSSFYSHLKRNWTHSTLDLNRMVKGGLVNRFEEPQNKRLQRLQRLHPLQSKTVLLSVKPGAKENVVVNTKLVDVNEHKAETAGGKGRKRKRVPVEESEEKKAKRKRQEERVKAREEKQQKKKERRLQTEHKKAVGLTTRATFNWAPEEDSLLLLCRVASTILMKKLDYLTVITWETVHHVFSKKVPSSVDLRNKDAKAIAKRSIRLLKGGKFKTNFAVCLGECAEDTDLMSSIPSMTGTHPPEFYTKIYEDLIDKLQEKFRHRDGQVGTLPDDITSLHRNYNVEPIARTEKAYKIFFNVENEADLKRLALHTIVLSSLMSQSASDYDAKLSYKLYEQYDASILHDVFLFCRLKGVISRSREGAVKQKRIAPSVPMSYQLSNTYIKHFRSEISLEVPDEALTCLKAIKQAEEAEGVQFPVVSPGACACQLILLAEDKIKCTIVVPKRLAVVDSNLLDPETLKQMGLLKKGVDSDSESDTDEESEDEEDEDDVGNEVGTIEGAVQGGETTTTYTDLGVVFEDADGKVNNADSVESLSNLEEAKPLSLSIEGNVMGMLEELASGAQNEIAQTGIDDKFTICSDHNYFVSKEISTDSAGFSDGVGKSTTQSRPGDITEAVESKQTPKDSTDVAQDGGEFKIPSVSQQKPATRNPTAKCLAASQSSFTKWLIAQGHYAPGICGKGRIHNLQDNIVLSTFTLKLRPSFPNSTASLDHSSQPNLFSSLLDYLIRPCKKYIGMETSCRSQESSQALYLQDLLKAKYLDQQEGSLEKLTERCSELGLSSPAVSTIIKVYNKINEAGFLGLTIPKLKRMVAQVNAGATTEVPLLRCMDLLLKQQMVFEVGANELCLVTMEHVSLWCIRSQRLISCAEQTDSEPSKKRLCPDIDQETVDLTQESNVPQRSVSSEEPVPESCSDTQLFQCVDLTKEPSASGIPEISTGGEGLEADKNKKLMLEVSPKQGDLLQRSEGKVNPDIIDMAADEQSTRDVESSEVSLRERGDAVEGILEQKTSESGRGAAFKRKQFEAQSRVYEPVVFQPYPWRKEDGTINQKELNRMMKGICLLVTEKPGIKESAILDNFKDILRRVDCQRILKMMSELQLITRHCVHLPQPGIFNNKSRRQTSFFHYHTSLDCLINIGTLLNDQD
ncbi:general transcription factor 3C polypeptide 1-like isoform X1 [Asterias rubens]|uniref:general transcription factor 3C polypeptide 1-like isoform X1 n=1 Tax=Asterias rubens TaxID=7604 RepID=UPI0014557420|nr:general transcription factor 3C polypeptide 1-like isoform X1 [Asterias rubens]